VLVKATNRPSPLITGPVEKLLAGRLLVFALTRRFVPSNSSRKMTSTQALVSFGMTFSESVEKARKRPSELTEKRDKVLGALGEFEGNAVSRTEMSSVELLPMFRTKTSRLRLGSRGTSLESADSKATSW